MTIPDAIIAELSPTTQRARAAAAVADFAMWCCRNRRRARVTPVTPAAPAPIRCPARPPSPKPAPKPAAPSTYDVIREQRTAAILAYLERGPAAPETIHRATNIPKSTVANILRRLLSQNKIVTAGTISVPHSRMTVYLYALPGGDNEWRHYSSGTTLERILAYLSEHGPATAAEVSDAIGINAGSIRHYLNDEDTPGITVVGVSKYKGHRDAKLFAYTGTVPEPLTNY